MAEFSGLFRRRPVDPDLSIHEILCVRPFVNPIKKLSKNRGIDEIESSRPILRALGTTGHGLPTHLCFAQTSVRKFSAASEKCRLRNSVDPLDLRSGIGVTGSLFEITLLRSGKNARSQSTRESGEMVSIFLCSFLRNFKAVRRFRKIRLAASATALDRIPGGRF